MYLISSGELEILSPVGQVGPGGGPDAGPLISGLDLAQLQEQADPDVWDTTTVSDISKEPGGEWGERGGGLGLLTLSGLTLLGLGVDKWRLMEVFLQHAQPCAECATR